MFFKPRLYMDYASSTPLSLSVVWAMARALFAYGNPSSPHAEGRRARGLVERARRDIARVLSVRPETLYFTGSGTESNVLATVGFIEELVSRGASYADLHMVTSAFEHPSILEPLKTLEKKGVALSYVEPTKEGSITAEAVVSALMPNTVLVTITAVQSEIGQVQPLRDIAHALRAYREHNAHPLAERVPECAFPVFHADASQGSLFLDLSPERLGVDMATYDAQKIEGPKGIGLLYKHSRVPLAPVIPGGSQERKRRAGTEHVLGIVGFARAFVDAARMRRGRATRVARVRDFFVKELRTSLPEAVVNGGMKKRIANNVHISVPGADGDYLAVLMDTEGIAVSPRSACIAGGTASGTVRALGGDESHSLGTLRFTFTPSVSKRDARRAVHALVRASALARGTQAHTSIPENRVP